MDDSLSLKVARHPTIERLVTSFHRRVDVLSEPFDAITRALLERQGQRRLIGFMGAAAVTTASRGEHVLLSSSLTLV